MLYFRTVVFVQISLYLCNAIDAFTESCYSHTRARFLGFPAAFSSDAIRGFPSPRPSVRIRAPVFRSPTFLGDGLLGHRLGCESSKIQGRPRGRWSFGNILFAASTMKNVEFASEMAPLACGAKPSVVLVQRSRQKERGREAP